MRLHSLEWPRMTSDDLEYKYDPWSQLEKKGPIEQFWFQRKGFVYLSTNWSVEWSLMQYLLHEQVRKWCPTTACSPLPGISSPSWYFQLWSSTHIQWSKVDRYISGRNSIRSNSNSFLPPILIICNRHSLTKLILITQLTQLIQLTQLTLITQLTKLTVTHSTHPNHTTHPTHQTH